MDMGEVPEQPPRFSPSMVLAQRFQIIRLIARGGMGDVWTKSAGPNPSS